jgi:hypothetical protein
MIRFRHAFWAITAVLVVHVIALFFDFYHTVGWFDVLMHFFGGYAMALLALALYGRLGERVEIKPRSHAQSGLATSLLQLIFVAGFVMIIGVAWEWYEFIFDQFATSMVAKYGVAQMGLPDTMDDLFNDCVGSLTAWVLWRKSL